LLNGVAVTIIVGQLGKVLGISLDEAQVIEKIMALPGRIADSHLLTFGLSLLTLAILMVIKTYRSHWPAPLIAIVITTALVWGTCTKLWDCHYWRKVSSLVYPSLTGRHSSQARCVI
jgi:MFS superfamily sulfate permease-like transporter